MGIWGHAVAGCGLALALSAGAAQAASVDADLLAPSVVTVGSTETINLSLSVQHDPVQGAIYNFSGVTLSGTGTGDGPVSLSIDAVNALSATEAQITASLDVLFDNVGVFQVTLAGILQVLELAFNQTTFQCGPVECDEGLTTGSPIFRIADQGTFSAGAEVRVVELAAVPLPASALLLLAGLGGLAARRRLG